MPKLDIKAIREAASKAGHIFVNFGGFDGLRKIILELCDRVDELENCKWEKVRPSALTEPDSED